MKKRSKDREPQKLVTQLDQLDQLTPEGLLEQWRTLFGRDPLAKLRSSLLVQAIAYRLQEKALGGLKPATLRLLERIADDAAAGRPVSTTPAKILTTTGTVLMREWHGRKHQVTVMEDGFLYRVKRFRSLSQIARAITGARWSGPQPERNNVLNLQVVNHRLVNHPLAVPCQPPLGCQPLLQLTETGSQQTASSAIEIGPPLARANLSPIASSPAPHESTRCRSRFVRE
jgi:hypothetical protein